VLPFAPAHVGLIGPLHSSVGLPRTRNGGLEAAGGQYRQRFRAQFSTAFLWTPGRHKGRAQRRFSAPPITPLDRPVHTCGERCGCGENPCKTAIFVRRKVPRCGHWKCVDTLLCSPLLSSMEEPGPRGWSNRSS
jgi:hypothetical protein